MKVPNLPACIWTIGHSTRTIDEFVALLQQHEIALLADVRRFPGSRRLPHFHTDALQASLAARGIDYQWFPGLGGRRRAAKDSPNDGWRNAAFKGYADHLHSEEFQDAFASLCEAACQRRTALMCAELLWWRCHRSLVSDVLKFHGAEVLHIQDEKHLSQHPYTAPARKVGGQLAYPSMGGDPLRIS